MSICVWRRLAALFLGVVLVGLSPAWAVAQTPARQAATANVTEIDAFVARQMTPTPLATSLTVDLKVDGYGRPIRRSSFVVRFER